MNPLLYRLYRQQDPIETLNADQATALDLFKSRLHEGEYTFEDAPCLCGSTSGILIAKRDRYGLHVNTYLCKICGVLRTSPRMDHASLEKFYDLDYRPIYVGRPRASEDFFREQISHGEQVRDFVSSNYAFEPASTVFDVGCGAGGMLVPFASSNCHVFGCDLGEEYLSRGVEHGLPLFHGDASVLEKYAPADLVILSHVLEHFADPAKELEKISSLIKNGGLLYIELPGVFNVRRAYGNFLLFLQNAHLYHFTLTTLSAFMSKMGYSLIEGDEGIRALYRKNPAVNLIDSSDEQKKILHHIYKLELLHLVDRNIAVRAFYTVVRLPFTHIRKGRQFLVRLLRIALGERNFIILKNKYRGMN